MFRIFKSKNPEPKVFDYELSSTYNSIFEYFQEKDPDAVERAKNRFIQLTGPFDEEHEYFESKLDDFRFWFIFYNGEKLFKNLEKIKQSAELSKYFEFLTSGIFSLFLVEKIKGDIVFLKDIFANKKYAVQDSVVAMSLDENKILQTSLHYKGHKTYEFGMSLIVHPAESIKYVNKEVKKIKKNDKKNGTVLNGFEDLMEKLLVMRYQFFKYKQLEVNQVYSANSLVFQKFS